MNNHIPVLNELPQLLAPIMHVLLIAWGLLDCFFGLRIFKVTVRFLMGFTGLFVGAAMAAHFQAESVPIMLGAALGGMIAGFLIGWYVYKAGLVLMAVMAGFVFAAPFQGVLGAQWGMLVPVVIGLVAGLLVFLMLEPVVILSTSLTGAFRLVFGAAFFMGGPSIVQCAAGQVSVRGMFAGQTLVVSVLTLVIAAAGCFAQFSAQGRRAGKKEE